MPLISNPQDINIIEEDEVQQILGRTPGWMLQWGSTFIALAFLLIIFLSAYIQYPAIVSAPIILTTEQPPIPVVARTNGKIAELNISEKQTVEEGMTLAVLDNPAHTADVLKLEAFLKKIEALESPEDMLYLSPPKSLKLGQLQNFYAPFILQLNDFTFFLNQKQAIRNIRALKRQIQEIENLNSELITQKSTLQSVHSLDQEKVERYTNLVNQGQLASAEQLEDAKIQALRSKRQLELLDTEVINNKLQIQRIEEKILSFKQSNKNNHSDKWFKILEQVQQINGQIALWKETFLLQAPISGQVTMPIFQNNNQFVKALDEVMYITPTGNNSGHIFGKANLPIPRAGKVEINQHVKIRLLDYPYQEYGVVKGKVKDIALVPTTDRNGTATYYVEVDLVEGLATTYGDSTLTFRQGMQGTAQIITQDQSVLGNLFNKIWSQIWN